MEHLEIDGARMPVLGLGTWMLTGPTCRRVVREALELGYRHVDTARLYENEAEVGAALRESGVPREELFVTTKLFAEDLAAEKVPEAVAESLAALESDWVDLLLVHWPSEEVPLEETLDALADVRARGLVRHLGVSNFPRSWLARALERSTLLCDQVEYHPYLAQDELLRACRARGIALVAYCPLARGRVPREALLARLGERHGRSAAQGRCAGCSSKKASRPFRRPRVGSTWPPTSTSSTSVSTTPSAPRSAGSRAARG
jgi:2,5-diketo-D-gluconate reductase B